MADFHYAGIAADGKSCQGSIRAASAEAARLRLLGQGITPTRLGNGASGTLPGPALDRSASTIRLKRADVLLFTREMAHLKRADIALDRALGLLGEVATNQRLKAFVDRVNESVRGGQSLYQALLPFERDLGRRYLVLIRAGEASGALAVVLKELAAQLEADDQLRQHIVSAMIYPAILLVVSALSVVVLLVFVVPQFREIFDSMGDALPYLTRLVLDISDFLRAHWLAVTLALAALLVLGRRWLASSRGRARLHTWLLAIPLLGQVLQDLQLAVYFRTLGGLLQRGVPLVESLGIAGDAVTNTALRADLVPLVDVVKGGKRLSTGFDTRWFAGSSTAQLLRVAEETGNLHGTATALADRYEEQGRRSTARVLAVAEPLIIIVLGLMVAVIIMAILGGVMSINETV